MILCTDFVNERFIADFKLVMTEKDNYVPFSVDTYSSPYKYRVYLII